MENINWQVGTPSKFGSYIVTTTQNEVDNDEFTSLGWLNYEDDDIVGWFCISDIQPMVRENPLIKEYNELSLEYCHIHSRLSEMCVNLLEEQLNNNTMQVIALSDECISITYHDDYYNVGYLVVNEVLYENGVIIKCENGMKIEADYLNIFDLQKICDAVIAQYEKK